MWNKNQNTQISEQKINTFLWQENPQLTQFYKHLKVTPMTPTDESKIKCTVIIQNNWYNLLYSQNDNFQFTEKDYPSSVTKTMKPSITILHLSNNSCHMLKSPDFPY